MQSISSNLPNDCKYRRSLGRRRRRRRRRRRQEWPQRHGACCERDKDEGTSTYSQIEGFRTRFSITKQMTCTAVLCRSRDPTGRPRNPYRRSEPLLGSRVPPVRESEHAELPPRIPAGGRRRRHPRLPTAAAAAPGPVASRPRPRSQRRRPAGFPPRRTPPGGFAEPHPPGSDRPGPMATLIIKYPWNPMTVFSLQIHVPDPRAPRPHDSLRATVKRPVRPAGIEAQPTRGWGRAGAVTACTCVGQGCVPAVD